MTHSWLRRAQVMLAALILLGSGGWTVVSAQAPSAGIDADDMDIGADPGEDFYRFANGGWEDRTEIPDDAPSYGIFDELQDEADSILADALDDLEADTTTPNGKSRSLYEQFIDEDQRDEDGIAPIADRLERIQAIETIADAEAYIAEDAWNRYSLFGVYVDPSLTDATLNILYITPTPLQIGGPWYYLSSEDEAEDIRAAWLEANTEMFQILGYDADEAETMAEAYLEFETELSQIMTPAQVYADPEAWNNPVTLDDLEQAWPSFDWETYFTTLGLDPAAPMSVDDPAWLADIAELLADSEPDHLVAFLQATLVWGNAANLSLDIADLSFGFFSGVLYGVTERRPIEERGLATVQITFPDTLGQIYVETAFSPESKLAIETLVDNLISAFAERIRTNTWMSDATKEEALNKLEMIAVKVGYPETWQAYDDVEIGDTLYDTIESAAQVAFEAELAQQGTAVDRGEWTMAAFEVNAYYNPQMNEIVFPAAILQAPFFDADADLASNYGAIGSIIGHEITHGFDQSGSRYDGEGNLREWWTPEDAEAFGALQDRIIDQYDAIEVIDGVFVDGALTIGENIADLGGVQTAYDALLIALAEDPAADQPWFLSQEQRFFIAFAVSWREEATDDWIEYLTGTDEHAPSTVRAVQPLRNMDEFFIAFDIDESDDEWLPEEERIVIW
jgi:predicted metalloendopeptidase